MTIYTHVDNVVSKERIFQYFLITRFSYRRYVDEKYGTFNKRAVRHALLDPLSEQNLEYRFLLFRILCLSSVLSQTSQNFTWILVIDRELPGRYLSILEKLTGEREDSHLVTYTSQSELAGLQWLNPWIKKNSDYVVTTNLDDDDALPRSFMATLQEHLKNHEAPCPFKLLVSKRAVQWDLICSSRAPLGWKRKWEQSYSEKEWPSSAGFSLACKRERMGISVYAVDHAVSEEIFNCPDTDKLLPFHRFCYNNGRRNILDASPDFDSWPPEWGKRTHYHDFSGEMEAALIGNHFHNQQGRLFQADRSRRKVLGEESFPGIEVNWNLLLQNKRLFTNTIKNKYAMLRRSARGSTKMTAVKDVVSAIWYLSRL